MTFRESTIAVSPIVPWALSRIAKARNSGGAVMSGSTTADSVADEVLQAWLADKHPELVRIWAERKALDKEADKAAGVEPVPF